MRRPSDMPSQTTALVAAAKMADAMRRIDEMPEEVKRRYAIVPEEGNRRQRRAKASKAR